MIPVAENTCHNPCSIPVSGTRNNVAATIANNVDAYKQATLDHLISVSDRGGRSSIASTTAMTIAGNTGAGKNGDAGDAMMITGWTDVASSRMA